jgi:hypothetical protein
MQPNRKGVVAGHDTICPECMSQDSSESFLRNWKPLHADSDSFAMTTGKKR